MAEGGVSVGSEFSDDDEKEEFQDARETMPETSDSIDIHAAIEDAAKSLDLFLNNSFNEAKQRLQRWSSKSMYHALGYGAIMCLQATMTFEAADIEAAIEVIKQSTKVCSRFRKKSGFIESFNRQKSYYDDLTAEEVHAELCYAECLLERALLTFIQDENLINFIRGSLRIKACYNSYRECIQILSKRNWKPNDEKIHFESGICLGVGMFNLMISLTPARVLKLLEFVGFSGSRGKGLHQLEKGAGYLHSLRGPLCAFSLIGYHIIITYVMGTGEGDVKYAAELNQQLLLRYPRGALMLFFDGRLKEVTGNIGSAISRFEESIDSQKLWVQLHHFCYWELMWCHCFTGDWLLAMKYAERLLAESKWSRATYAYQKAVFLLMCDDQSDSTRQHVAHLFEQIPKLKQRIAGKSLPIEKFAVKKSELYFEQNNRLTLPAYELLYVWNGFLIVSKLPEVLDAILRKTETTLEEIASRKEKYIHFTDDYCLAMLIKAVCLRHKGNLQQAEECFKYIVQRYKELQVDKYLVPCALYELAMMYIGSNRYEEAEDILDKARHDYKGYSLETRIHFRMQAARLRLNSLKESSSQGSEDRTADAAML